MRKKLIIIISTLLLCVLLFFSVICVSQNQEAPEEAILTYNGFLDAFLNGTYSDVERFLYMESPDDYAITRDNFTNIWSVEILKWKRINENLWVVSTFVTFDIFPEGSQYNHFVGRVADDWYVMTNPYLVPDFLSQGVNLTKYSHPDALPPEANRFQTE